jgi:ADP-heptose:LPS heptosyltransferase
MKPRLAVFELHHFGDAVMALPFLRGARVPFDVTVVCRAPVAEFLRAALPDISVVSVAEGWSALRQGAATLALGPADATCSVWADTRVHLAMARSGAGRRAGLPMTAENYYAPHLSWRARRLFLGRLLAALATVWQRKPLLTDPVHRRSTDQHHLATWAQLAERLGIVPDVSVPWVEGPVTAGTPSPGLVIHPGGRLPTKRWPYFQALLEGMADQPVTLLAAPGEAALVPAGPGHRVVQPTDWPEFFGLLAGAQAVLANDSFPAHLAAAFGRPVLAIFGSGNPDWFSPGNNPGAVIATRVCPHRPCIDRCVMASPVCLESVSPEVVETRLRSLGNTG